MLQICKWVRLKRFASNIALSVKISAPRGECAYSGSGWKMIKSQVNTRRKSTPKSVWLDKDLNTLYRDGYFVHNLKHLDNPNNMGCDVYMQI